MIQKVERTLSAMAGNLARWTCRKCARRRERLYSHGVLVGELSPMKDSRSTVGVRYFEGQFSDGKKTVRSISF